jgi:hypothetical protein
MRSSVPRSGKRSKDADQNQDNEEARTKSIRPDSRVLYRGRALPSFGTAVSPCDLENIELLTGSIFAIAQIR